jgi:putative (di)nucleoside polyphosphate hydrolase
VPLDVVIEFKRDVYLRALQELSRFLTRPGAPGVQRHTVRYLRQPLASRPAPGMPPADADADPGTATE